MPPTSYSPWRRDELPDDADRSVAFNGLVLAEDFYLGDRYLNRKRDRLYSVAILAKGEGSRLCPDLDPDLVVG